MIKKILVPLDGSELAERSLPYAVELAQALGAKLILLGVVPPPPGRAGGYFKMTAEFMTDKLFPDTLDDFDKSLHPISKDSMMASQEAEVKRKLLPVAERLQQEGLDVEVVVAFGRPPEGIFHYVQHNNIDLIVMCTHGENGLHPYAYGGTADRVARRAFVPVLLVRPEEISQLLPLPKIDEGA